MSNNQPILIKNPAPQQVEFSEVTGKITRKVNHFNDHAAKVTGGVEETLHEQAATTVVNRQHASEAGQNASARLQGEAGLAVRPNIQQAADSSAAENRVHEDGTNRLTDGGAAPRSPLAHPQLNKQQIPSAANVPVANELIEAAEVDRDSILHEAAADSQVNTVYAVAPTAAINFMVAPQTVAPVKQDGGEEAGVSEAKLLRPAEAAAENPISDAVPSWGQNVVFAPLSASTLDEAGPGENAAKWEAPEPTQAAEVPSEPSRLQPPVPVEVVDARAVQDYDRSSEKRLKISAVVEQHMRKVGTETARLNQLLERLENQYASLEKGRR